MKINENMKEDIEVCSCNDVHKEKVEVVKNSMITEDDICELGEFFKVLSDNTRIKILFSLSKEEMCVCDIAELLQMGQSAVSHQLRVLRAARLVKYRRQGKEVYYSLDDEHVEDIFNEGLDHVREK